MATQGRTLISSGKRSARAKEPTRANVLEQLRQIEYTGIYGTWHFDENGDITPASISGRQVQNGDWTMVIAYASGTSCIVAMGEHWSVLAPQDPA